MAVEIARNMKQEPSIPLHDASISPNIAYIYKKLQRGEQLFESELNVLATRNEAALILSFVKGSRVRPQYLNQMRFDGRLPQPEAERPMRYRIRTLLQVRFDPPGPKKRIGPTREDA